MAWTGHISDENTARRSSMAALVGDTNLGMVDADTSSVAVAEAAALANANNIALTHVSERFFGVNTARGFRVASNLGGTFSSSFTTLYASLPSNDGLNKTMMING